MDDFESPELEALPFEEISDDCPPTPEYSDSSDVVSSANFKVFVCWGVCGCALFVF